MGIPVHILETAAMLLVAYLIGCGLGFSLRRLSRWRPRPAFKVAAASTTLVPVAPPAANFTAVTLRRPSAAARLAMSVANEPPEAPTPTRAPDGRPPAFSAPLAGGKDNLQRIKGIGPKIEERLNGWGIYHFEQLAALTPDNAAWIDGQLGFRGRVARESWIGQAAMLASV